MLTLIDSQVGGRVRKISEESPESALHNLKSFHAMNNWVRLGYCQFGTQNEGDIIFGL